MNWLKTKASILKSIHNINSVKLGIKNEVALFGLTGDFLANGFTLIEALDFYSLIHPKMKESILILKTRLSRGESFAEAIKDLIDFRTYCQLKIAEFHGNLILTLNQISQFLKMKQKQRSRLVGLLMYPIFLLILLVGIIAGIRILVTPQLQGFNAGSNGHHYLLWSGLTGIPLLLVAYGFYKYYRERDRVWQLNLLLKIPAIGPVYRAYYAYYLSNNLALMMNCGMDLKRIVKFMASFNESQLVMDLSWDIRRLMNRGRSINQLIRKYHFLPREMLIMMDSGDTTDVLAQKLKSYARLEFKLMMKRASRLISMLQPVMFLIIGLVITGTYLSMLLPMYNSIKGVY